jgi:RNA ligase (TIGR02306 family)
MSDLLVKVLEVTDVRLHPNAERLEIVSAGGWEIVSGKSNYKVGDTVVHVPPDAMVPRPLAEQWGVAQYLSFANASPEKGRVKAAKLRGFVSYGFFAPNDSGAAIGANLMEHYGIDKYEPPPPPIGLQAGQMARNHPLFHTYTDMQNLRNFPDQLDYSQELVVLEKIHGTNSRIGWVRSGESLEAIMPGMTSFLAPTALEMAIGTHRTQRKPEDAGVYAFPYEKYKAAFDKLLFAMNGDDLKSLIVFGEIYGPGVQDLHYDTLGVEKGYRVFDIAVDGRYIEWSLLEHICRGAGLPLVPELARGHFTFEQLCGFAAGDTMMGGKHIREGVVVRPANQELVWGKGTMDPHPKRMIFKLISGDYLTRKGGTEYH